MESGIWKMGTPNFLVEAGLKGRFVGRCFEPGSGLDQGNVPG